jgi:hypothetical protein
MESTSCSPARASTKLGCILSSSASRQQPQPLEMHRDHRSSSTISSGLTKITKAAMARRFLLRGRKTNTGKKFSPNHHSPNSTTTATTTSSTSSNSNSCISTTPTCKSRVNKIKTSNIATTACTDATPATEVATCVICCDDMDAIDSSLHPVACMNCTFNCCTTCTQSLLEQSLPSIGESFSDASFHKQSEYQQYTIKCPNCRSDLSRTIYDTALLRIVDRESNGQMQLYPENTRIQTEVGLLFEVDMARKRETQFVEFQKQQKRSNTSVPNFLNPSGSNSSSFSFDGRQLFQTNENAWYEYDRNGLIDVTLLCGLENMMTWYEQEQVTRYCTSNRLNQLAMAAKILYETRTKLQLQQQQQQQHHSAPLEGSSIVPSVVTETGTIYQLIEAGKRARYRSRSSSSHHSRHPSTSSAESPSPTITDRKRPEYYTKLSTQKATQFRKIENEVRQQTAYIKRYPLPNRLPKYCECQIVIDCSNNNDNSSVSASQIVKRLPFRFCNDEWDGSIMDAYTKFIVQRCTTTYDPKKLLRGKNYSGKTFTRRTTNSTFVDNYKVHQRRPCDDINILNILNIENLFAPDIGSFDNHNDYSTYPTEDSRDVCASTTGITRENIDRETEPTLAADNSRVMIASVVDMNVANMILPGDVMTHINGIELHDYTVDDVIALICSLCDSESIPTSSTKVAMTKACNDDKPPSPPPMTSSSSIAQTTSMIDDPMGLFTNPCSASVGTNSSNVLTPSSSSSPKRASACTPLKLEEQRSPHLQEHKVLQLQFVFNADVAVAKALQLRATAIRWAQGQV